MEEVKIRVGRLLPGYQFLSEGINAPVRGMAALEDGEVAVIAKKIGARALAVELVCAYYGRSVGLPIPEPLLLVDDEEEYHFGSVDIGHPSLAQFVRSDDTAVHDELLQWPDLIKAACFDELVVNPDRHNGNLLYDGERFSLIDHDLCIPSGMSPTAPFTPDDANALLFLKIESLPLDDLARRRLLKEAEDWIRSHPDAVISESALALDGICTPAIQSHLVSFLRDRLAVLSDLLHAKINPEQGRINWNDG